MTYHSDGDACFPETKKMRNGPPSHSQHENGQSVNMSSISTAYYILNNRNPIPQSNLRISYCLVSDKH